MQIERLRLAGFKSFVEPTELAIEPGLTGIVGPNGCGKSNLVEALRWVMGEASARRLRGGEMDDVIFAGSASRPPRNLAEAALTIDNSGRAAPFAYNESTTIEVVRRVARGAGSAYRINGRDARARDVQLLFADAASGPHSGALVGQGRIGALIAAKPSERRLLLDEAAGTAGLQTRRHEAELKLQAAEANLARLDDVIATLAAQIETLKKQARQAMRYRRLGEQIRRLEALALQAQWLQATAEVEALSGELRHAERDLAGATAAAIAAERERAEAEAALPPLRLAQASAAAAAARLVHAREALEHELARVVAARDEAGRRQSQLAADLDREAEHLADAESALVRLADERRALDQGERQAGTVRAQAAGELERAAADLAAAEAGLQQMTEACATGEARRTALDRQCRELAERRQRLQARLAEAARQRAALLADVVPPEALAAAAAASTEAAAAVEQARDAASATAEMLRLRQREEAAATDARRDAERQLAGLRTEAAALTRLLAPAAIDSAGAAPMLSLLQVPAGFEAAAAALFDGELKTPLLPDQPTAADVAAGWVELAALPSAALPDGAHPLAAELTAPPALARRLAHSGWVDSADDGWRLQRLLGPGQSLVDRDGRLWRWDGFARTNAGAGATAEVLRQRNRLVQVEAEIASAAADVERLAVAAASKLRLNEAAAEAEREAAAVLRAAEERLAQVGHAEAELSRRSLAAEARLAAVDETIERLGAELAEAAEQETAAAKSLALLPEPTLARTGLDAARSQAAAARRREHEARAALDRLAGESASRQRRLAAIGDEEGAWRKRREGAAAQRAALLARHETLAGEIEALAARPAAIALESDGLAAVTSEMAAKQRDAEDALAVGETRFRDAAEAARRADAGVGEARERRAGLLARREAAADRLAALRGRISERLGAPPEALAAMIAEGGVEASGADPAEIAARLDRLVREREAIGPVNLLAEREMSEVTAQFDGLQRERADLTEAIARLRRGIAALDHEARERLRTAFAQLNSHFGELFRRLFGGGTAELAWADDEDPLAAGLDIVARPPGKRLQALSLLSGGEQALTAIALIFAVFLTNPAPICVLDEVDAPLDDANVDGFCRLVADIADTTGTRFLLITHHRVTMARMDRLYGVTMAERGVSQLVSVDLARAAELRQSA